ncbi:MAG TPA: VOC family protein [Actinophytocola sp.]|uniref:VOC family protein n=1 Tax=Actinophytocola sp. TaxID=1872138 RepID=UPI002DDD1AA6|nr:VOC family protein [Actinophytocola sp.]HEV2778729.1 VOC family protein [Actinophytocola sp.]
MPEGLGYFVVHVPDALRAKEFYGKTLGWRTGDGEDPKGYHHIEGSSPHGGISGGAREPRIDASFLVRDAKATVGRIRELGGSAPDPREYPSGWSAECTDDQGGRFGIWQPSADYAPAGPAKPGDGDLFYFVLPTADDGKAKRFYGALLGWEFTTGTHPRGWNIANIEPPGGLFGAGAAGPISVYFQVPDIEAAVAAVRAAGGTADPVETNKVGWHAACRDDQGTQFYLGSLRDS